MILRLVYVIKVQLKFRARTINTGRGEFDAGHSDLRSDGAFAHVGDTGAGEFNLFLAVRFLFAVARVNEGHVAEFGELPSIDVILQTIRAVLLTFNRRQLEVI